MCVCVWGAAALGVGSGLLQESLHFASISPVPFLPHFQWTKSTAVNDLGPKGALAVEASPELGGQRARASQEEEGLAS